MFHDIPEAILRADGATRGDGRARPQGRDARLERLRQVPRDVGRFAAILAAGTPPGRWIEIGTSAGYSTLWLALACREPAGASRPSRCWTRRPRWRARRSR